LQSGWLPRFGCANQSSVTTIGLDIAKSFFQFHGIERKAGRSSAVSKPRYVLAFFQKLPFLIGIEARATSHRFERQFRERPKPRMISRAGISF
jgi:transposase